MMLHGGGAWCWVLDDDVVTVCFDGAMYAVAVCNGDMAMCDGGYDDGVDGW